MAKKVFVGVLSVLLFALLLTGCASASTNAKDKIVKVTDGQTQAQMKQTVATENKIEETRGSEGKDIAKNEMLIKISVGEKEIVMALNNTSVSRSFYAQLPMTVTVENYGHNEKIFQPNRKLDCSDVQEGACPVGTVAYFSPWNNVCLYYGDAPRYNGLYVMGKAIRGAENIRNISGKIRVESVK